MKPAAALTFGLLPSSILCAASSNKLADEVQSIVNGTESAVGRYSYIVNLNSGYYSDGSIDSYCGGSLVASDVVLTAAHCVDDFWLGYVGIGGHNKSSWEGEVIGMKEIILHPKWDPSTNEFDIALVLLNESTTLDVSFVELNADASYPIVGDISRVMGWGDTSSGGNQSDVLMEVDLPIMSNGACNETNEGGVTEDMICAFEEGKDSCQGDSGGPLIIPGETDEDDVQVGVVSWGYGCAESPGVYSRVSYVIDWIKRNACKESVSPPRNLCDGSYSPTTSIYPTPTETSYPTWSSTESSYSPTISPHPTVTPAITQSPSTTIPTYSPTISEEPTGSPVSAYACVSAQKVKIELETGKPLHMFEVQVFSGDNNVALGMPATQSSTFAGNDGKYGASKAVDGDSSSISHTASGAKHWWEVELNPFTSVPVDSLTIMNRWCGDPSDSNANCLCRMSDARIYFYDEIGDITQSVQIEDTCDKSILNFDLLCTQIKEVGNNGEPNDVFPLGKCQGDCDPGYNECAEGLSCMDRDIEYSIPGCFGDPSYGWAYCVVRPVNHLWYVGDEGERGLLGKCESDCDDDSECEGGLVCFQRDEWEPVPGCTGVGEEGYDYCYDPADDVPTPSPTIYETPEPTPSPSVCTSPGRKIKITSITGEFLHMFEVQAWAGDVNVALNKPTSQGSDFQGNPNKFGASKAVDGDATTFSHTNADCVWWEVDLGSSYDISSITIKNRFCGGPADSPGCLCRLSHAAVSIVDKASGNIAKIFLGDMCGELEWIIDANKMEGSSCETLN